MTGKAESTFDDGVAQHCPESAAYNQIFTTAIENIYDPNSLGDWKYLAHKYDCQINSQEGALKFAEKALSQAHDPYTRIDRPVEVAEDRAQAEGSEIGLGGRLRSWNDSKKESSRGRQQKLFIEEVFPNSPLEKAGLQVGDRIKYINHAPVSRMTQADLVEHLNHGKKFNLPLSMQIEHQGSLKSVSILQTEIDVPAVQARDVGNGITYLRVSNFSIHSLPAQMKDIMEKHKDSKGFILDLRGNPGGNVRDAFDTAQLFVDSGEFSTIVKREASPPSETKYQAWSWIIEKDKALELNKVHIPGSEGLLSQLKLTKETSDLTETTPRLPNLLAGRPLVVLTSENTASAAETFTDAMRTLAHAKVIGETTFGKGVVQNDFGDMPGGASLHLTTGRLRTASGAYLGNGNNDKHGLVPDIKIPVSASVLRTSKEDQAFNEALKLLDSSN